MSRARLASFQPDLGERRLGWKSPATSPGPTSSPRSPRRSRPAWESSPHVKEEEFTRAVALGLFDYLRKSRSQGFVVSLSGGADSSAVACLVALMVEMAVAELGAEGVPASAVAHPGAGRRQRRRAIACAACCTASTRPPGNSSRDHAQRRHASWPRRSARRCRAWRSTIWSRATSRAIERRLGRKLTWETDDVALQNIQARVRGPSVWLLANVKNALLLSTSNRSEAAVGYATMDGDTCGGLSPIAGIDKAFLLQLAALAGDGGPGGRAPAPGAGGRQPASRRPPSCARRPPARPTKTT